MENLLWFGTGEMGTFSRFHRYNEWGTSKSTHNPNFFVLFFYRTRTKVRFQRVLIRRAMGIRKA